MIRSSVEHLERHREEPLTASSDALDDIEAEVDHLTIMVDDLLLLARTDSGAVTLDRLPVDLGDVAQRRRVGAGPDRPRAGAWASGSTRSRRCSRATPPGCASW